VIGLTIDTIEVGESAEITRRAALGDIAEGGASIELHCEPS
jgi:hypothetical protein